MFPTNVWKGVAFLFIAAALAFAYGMGVGLFALREPDTCFLLAMGRWICRHKALPITDPFSYTFAMFPQMHGLVVYQWLTEVIFYSIAKLASVVGLVIFTCIMLAYALIITPWRILNCFKLGTLRAGLITVLIALGSIERMMLKPEIFSYLFLALYLEAMIKQELGVKSGESNWKLPTFLTLLMILWANLHSGFVIGILLLLVLSLRDLWLAIYYRVFQKNDNYAFANEWSISLVLCLGASLITPYGISLWRYIPHLYFHPINQYINELQPVSVSLAIHNLPLLLSVGCLLLLAVFRVVSGRGHALTRSNFVYLLIAVIGMVLGLVFQRLITFGLLLTLPLIGSGFRVKTTPTISLLNKPLPMVILGAAITGSLSVVLFGHQTIPATSKAFVPPFEALNCIIEKNPQGNVLNDPEFGDVLMWNDTNPPKLFVDTRFDMYPWQILQDYMTMVNCKPAWQGLLARYKINWIFLMPETTLCHRLENNSAWHVIFKNEHAEIIVYRKQIN